MSLLGKLEKMEKERICGWVMKCQFPDGSFSGNIGHDPHILYTLSALQILALFDELDRIDKPRIVKYIKNLQQKDGSFVGDTWGEVDTRFSYCALQCLALVGRLPEGKGRKGEHVIWRKP